MNAPTNTRLLANITRDKAFDLARNGQVAFAIVMWHRYKTFRGGCTCEPGFFDQHQCGGCLLDGLQAENRRRQWHDLNNHDQLAKQAVFEFLTQLSATPCALAARA